MTPLSVAQFLCGGMIVIRAAVSKLFPGDLQWGGEGTEVLWDPRGSEVEAKPLASFEQSKDADALSTYGAST